MKNVIITGSNGMIGNLILENCLSNPKINKITSIVRRKSGINHPKLIEIVHTNFEDFTEIESQFKNQDICFYCIGVYTGQVSTDEFAKITINFTRAFAQTLRKNNENTTFCFLSGQGADSSEKSKMMFAKDKGIAENILFNLNFKEMYSFRPGYIYPVTQREEPNLFYKITRILYKPFLSKIYPNIGVTSEKLANTMVDIGCIGNEKTIFENNDIRLYKNA
ncbi:NAD-dependent epimerase/dehydratase family protein [Flavobacterium sp.]|uniref:NAD-dependent epimerase/dehydratase family protein n=1 Tax=Flavobacterium sp. TaxID=239 RepID=UPI0037B6FCBF